MFHLTKASLSARRCWYQLCQALCRARATKKHKKSLASGDLSILLHSLDWTVVTPHYLQMKKTPGYRRPTVFIVIHCLILNIRNLSILGFLLSARAPGTNLQWIQRDGCITQRSKSVMEICMDNLTKELGIERVYNSCINWVPCQA